MRQVPHDRNGYSIDEAGAVVHTRYARHGDVRPRVRGFAGIRAVLGDRLAIPCAQCYPEPAERPAEKPSRSRARRPAVDDIAALTAEIADAAEVSLDEAKALLPDVASELAKQDVADNEGDR